MGIKQTPPYLTAKSTKKKPSVLDRKKHKQNVYLGVTHNLLSTLVIFLSRSYMDFTANMPALRITSTCSRQTVQPNIHLCIIKNQLLINTILGFLSSALNWDEIILKMKTFFTVIVSNKATFIELSVHFFHPWKKSTLGLARVEISENR